MRLIIGFLILGAFFAACKKTSPEEQARIDRDIILDYLNQNDLEAEETADGIFYFKTEVGNGAQPVENDDVLVAYKGYYTNNGVFDESDPTGIEFNLQQVIQGWTKGIPLFKEGGRGTLLIPSGLAYGPDGRGSVPANAVLIFDIHLIEVL